MHKSQKTQIIAVEEHFVTDAYFDETAHLAVPPDEEPDAPS